MNLTSINVETYRYEMVP